MKVVKKEMAERFSKFAATINEENIIQYLKFDFCDFLVKNTWKPGTKTLKVPGRKVGIMCFLITV